MTTSEQARADALADAETLMLNLYGVDAGRWAESYGFVGGLGRVYYHCTAVAEPERAAHLAFLAVPGLRGR